MALSKQTQDTNFTTSVKTLSRQIFGKSYEKESMLDYAIAYFLEQNIDESETVKSQAKLDKELMHRELEREKRHQHLDKLCRDILSLSEGETFAEDNRKSSQVLATIQLLSPSEGSKVALSNELNKPLYKAVLCLRLLDRLCIDNAITEIYIKERLANIPPQKYTMFSRIDPAGFKRFVEEVKLPLIKAALLQDIGNNHPEAQLILKGESGTENPFRMLDVEKRKKLLQIDYRETVKYLIDGIGRAKYVGNLRDEREAFDEAEKRKLVFIKTLLKSSISPKKGIGNLLKVPQIYTSMILSTKPKYDYKLLPKVYQVLDKNAEKGVCYQLVVDALRTITGIFPLGYGVTYIAENIHGEMQFSYEYAIVKHLYPENPELPICRTATRNLAFISFGQDIIVSKERNLHFPEAAKKLSKISKERLNEILALLSSNYTERKELDLIPRCWFANEYFSIKAHQKLWNK
ncbi:hypothetical protein [Pseudocolwellia agarivorans]|uniref:hypothetical protein n=1 Tax=Pseudocolwellia agarivorans TaxID=1911682 RepID=UPI0009863627|nr:hypothetical protein [Pseudocolwellia agarivorans]